MHVDPQRAIAELKELRALTSDEHGAQRIAWSDKWLQAREWFTSKLRDLPVERHYDAAGNHWIVDAGLSQLLEHHSKTEVTHNPPAAVFCPSTHGHSRTSASDTLLS